MSFLQQPFGDPRRQQDYQDFISRYDEGPPWAGISDQEAVDRYQQVAPHLPPGAYQQAAQEAFSRMSPEERLQFAQYVQQQARQQGIGLPGLPPGGRGGSGGFQDPGMLAQLVGGLSQQQPNLLAQLLTGGGGGAGGGLLSNPLAKAALAGIAATAVRQMMGRR